ncbi:DsbA family protein [Alteromonadaceae bacterium M269]|nr:DsbA family protein [Alteromonadaceae bacterium M269]
MNQATLFYIHDPMCSWCWGFNKTWQTLRQQLEADNIAITYVMGGLAPDSDQPMPADMQKMLQNTWARIEKTIPGTQFNYDFWSKCQPRRSTYPACRAVIAAKQINIEYEAPMILEIQKAYYLHAQNPSNNDTLTACAQNLGLDPDEFSELLGSTLVQQTLEQNIGIYHQLARATGVSGFPSLVISNGETLQGVGLDYLNANTMYEQIREFLA